MQRSGIIRKAIALGRQRGFVTFDELDELLPSARTAAEDIEAVMTAPGDEGIHLVEDDQGPLRIERLQWNPARSLHENCACIGCRETPGFDPGASCVSLGPVAGV